MWQRVARTSYKKSLFVSHRRKSDGFRMTRGCENNDTSLILAEPSPQTTKTKVCIMVSSSKLNQMCQNVFKHLQKNGNEELRRKNTSVFVFSISAE